MRVWLELALAGAIGAPLRMYVIDLVDTSPRRGRIGVSIPAGTLVVNTVGSFLAGFLAGLVRYQGLSVSTQVVLGAGFCGAFTTFSTFAFETVRLIEQGRPWNAIKNTTASLACGALAASVGMAAASLL